MKCIELEDQSLQHAESEKIIDFIKNQKFIISSDVHNQLPTLSTIDRLRFKNHQNATILWVLGRQAYVVVDNQYKEYPAKPIWDLISQWQKEKVVKFVETVLPPADSLPPRE